MHLLEVAIENAGSQSVWEKPIESSGTLNPRDECWQSRVFMGKLSGLPQNKMNKMPAKRSTFQKPNANFAWVKN